MVGAPASAGEEATFISNYRRRRLRFFFEIRVSCLRLGAGTLIPDICLWACSSARLERTPDKREVGSSSLPRPTSQNSDTRVQMLDIGWYSYPASETRPLTSVGGL